MRTSLKNRLLRFLKNNPNKWFPKGYLCDLAREKAGYIGENTGRRLRELHEDGKLERKEMKGHVWYKYTLNKYETLHQTFLRAGVGRKNHEATGTH